MSKEMRVAIISGVVSSVLVIIFVQPVLEFLWHFILSFGESVQAGYVDKIYKNAALGDRSLGSNFTLLIQLIFMSFLGLFVLTMGNASQAVINMVKRLRHVFAISLLTMSTMLLLLFSISAGIAEISASFNQRLAIISPAISNLEIKQYKAMWAGMRNQDDYREIVKKMEGRALELHIKLPELRNP